MKNNHILKLFLAVFTIINFNTLFSAAAGAGASAKEVGELLPAELAKLSGDFTKTKELDLLIILVENGKVITPEVIKIKDTDKISDIKKEIIKRHPRFKNKGLILQALDDNKEWVTIDDITHKERSVFSMISLKNPALRLAAIPYKAAAFYLNTLHSILGNTQE